MAKINKNSEEFIFRSITSHRILVTEMFKGISQINPEFMWPSFKQKILIYKETHSAKWLSVRLQIKWLWVRVSLQSLQSTYYGTNAVYFRGSPAGIYLIEVNNRNTRTRCEIRRRRSGVFIVNFEHILHLVLVFLLLTLNM